MNFGELPPKNEDGGLFVRLKDGEDVKGVLRGDPKGFYVIWNGTKSIPAKKGEDGAKFRFKINIVVNEGGKLVPKVFEQGSKLFWDMKDLSDDYNLHETVVKIKRKGNGLETEYTIVPMPDRLNDEALKALGEVELNSLASKKKSTTSELGIEPSFDDSEEIPF